MDNMTSSYSSSYSHLPRYQINRTLYRQIPVNRSPAAVAAQQETFEELKKILILAGAFFFILIVVIMSKLQVGTEEVLRWSPVVWLFGVVIAGGIMNLIFYLQRKYKERKRRRRHHAQTLLYSLPIPSSFPCLAPPPHVDCCRAVSNRPLPSYDEAIRAKEQEDLPPPYSTAIQMIDQNYCVPPPIPV